VVRSSAVPSEHSPKPAEPADAIAPTQSSEDAARALEPTAAAAPSDPDAWLGRVLDDRYRILRLLGEGGMGAVFIAEHLTLHKQVALKVVRAELAGNGEVAARFAREAMATAQFEHPHVASAIDYGTLPEGGAYFVMQLVRGRSLRALLAAQQRLPWRRVCELAAQVADALSAAKAAGIIHRDLKPDNVLVERREDGSDLVKVLDFGIAHVAPRDSLAPAGPGTQRELTRVGTVMGTPGYMAPEQAVGDKVDHRADLYALGVVIWEAISGLELWAGPDLTSVVTRQMSEPVPKLRELAIDATIPAGLDDLVQRLVALSAAQRPDHAAEVRDELRRLAQAETSPAWVLPASLTRISTPLIAHARPHVTRAIAAYKAQPKAVQRTLAGAALAAVVVPLLLMPSKPPPPSAAAPLAAAASEPMSSETARAPAPTPAAPSMLERVVRAATGSAPPAAPAKTEPALPAALTEAASDVVEGKTARARRAAAKKLLAHQPREQVPAHLRVLAEFENARSCKAQKASLGTMEEQLDPRYLPTLRRLDRQRRSGCGFLDLSDCLSCIREDVREALDAIERADPRGGDSAGAPEQAQSAAPR
jgi:serine/threonine-protein kinase